MVGKENFTNLDLRKSTLIYLNLVINSLIQKLIKKLVDLSHTKNMLIHFILTIVLYLYTQIK